MQTTPRIYPHSLLWSGNRSASDIDRFRALKHVRVQKSLGDDDGGLYSDSYIWVLWHSMDPLMWRATAYQRFKFIRDFVIRWSWRCFNFLIVGFIELIQFLNFKLYSGLLFIFHKRVISHVLFRYVINRTLRGTARRGALGAALLRREEATWILRRYSNNTIAL